MTIIYHERREKKKREKIERKLSNILYVVVAQKSCKKLRRIA